MSITKADVQEIFAKVKANSAALNACPGPHDFSEVIEDPTVKLFPKRKCSKCRGIVDGSAYHWYQRGLDHGKAMGAQPMLDVPV
jgi:hypothetical protein